MNASRIDPRSFRVDRRALRSALFKYLNTSLAALPPDPRIVELHRFFDVCQRNARATCLDFYVRSVQLQCTGILEKRVPLTPGNGVLRMCTTTQAREHVAETVGCTVRTLERNLKIEALPVVNGRARKV